MTEPGHQSAPSVVWVLSSQLKELRRRHAKDRASLR